ncbi:MAG: hypothetical protein JXJ04_14415 [Spirochaetales bacterium]|nr:hypothetical protein [Spirochaetales bacterium]
MKTHIPGEIELIHKNNLIVSIPSSPQADGKKDLPFIALTAHLDKINHFKDTLPDTLPVRITSDKIIGQLDDAVGVGICLFLGYLSQTSGFPPLLLLFSEMEENGEYVDAKQGLVSGLGAQRIARHLIAAGKIPRLVVTIDTTPFYRGNPGISLYSRFWEISKTDVSKELVRATENLESYFLTTFPDIMHKNNTNDFITYGKAFNANPDHFVPSIALEPGIYPYHQPGEGVFLPDIRRIVSIITTFLNQHP